MNDNIQEDYCSFEVSKLLKKKGFGVLVNSYYEHNGDIDFQYKYQSNYNCSVSVGLQTSRPTHSLAIKWIRENFGIHIKLDWFTDDERSIDWDFSIQKIGTDIDEGGNSEYLRDYDVEIGFKTLEEATEVALLYTLKNLI